jgi:hypothetical protein
MSGSTAGALALLGVYILGAIPLLLLLRPANRQAIARMVREHRAAAAREKERRRRP